MSVRRLPIWLLLLLAFALRLYRLEWQSLWWDEGISLHLATSTLPDLLADRLSNIHPPLYFVVLKGWLNLVGLGAFNGRYLSTLASLLQIPLLYALFRRWFKLPSWTAVFLLTFSPIAIIYAQEMRVYALLPTVYLGLLAVAHVLRAEPNRWQTWFLFGLLQWLAIHLHYVAIFALVLLNAWLVVVLWPQGQAVLRRWLATNMVAGGLSLPWLGAVVWNLTAVRAHAELGTYTAEPTPIPFLIGQVWGFHLTGLPAASGDSLIRIGLVAVALLFGLLLVLAGWWSATRQTAVFFSAAWLLPVVAAFAFWSVRSFAHPRYVIMYAVLLYPLAAWAVGIVWEQKVVWGRLLAGLLATLLVLLGLWGVGRYFFDPAVAKDDVRGVARYLETVAQPNDLILIPDTDWSLPFEYRGEASVRMAGLDDRAQMWTNLAAWTRPGQTVHLFDYDRGTYDFQDVQPYLLETAGTLLAEQPFGHLTVRSYQLTAPIMPPVFTETNGRFGSLHLRKVAIEPDPTTAAVTVALQWQVVAPLPARYSVALRLQEANGWVRGVSDRLLVDENGRPTEQWAAGDQPTTYHVIPVQLGTPPLDYDVALTVYEAAADGSRPLDLLDAQGAPQGQQLVLDSVSLLRAAANLYVQDDAVAAWAEPQPLGAGLLLQGVASRTVPPSSVPPGQSLLVQLRWQRAGEWGADDVPQLILQQGEQLLASETAVYPAYPPDQWQPNEIVIVAQRLRVPPTASGAAQLVVRHGDAEIVLDDIQIEAGEHLFAPPQPAYPLDVVFGDVARLVGYDLPQQSFSAADPVPLTLYWESLAAGGGVDYVVFAHLLDENGRLVGQHDAPPANGQRPTTSWVANEFVVDPHEMVFREPFVGVATIEVGLYDPLTNGRLPTSSGQDFVYLPLKLTIE